MVYNVYMPECIVSVYSTVIYYNFVFIPDFDHEKLVKLLQQI